MNRPSTESSRSTRGRSRWAASGIAAGVILLAIGLSLIYFAGFEPKHVYEPFDPYEGYPTAPMQEAMEADRVGSRQDDLVEMGSRFMGQKGFRQASDYVRQAFEEAGLEVFEQELQTVAPQTASRSIYRIETGPKGLESARELRDVEIFPFMPNHLQPVVTPSDGLTGELVLLDEETLKTRRRFDDVIGLIDSREGQVAPGFGYDWTRYANLGVMALIVSHSEGLEEAPWTAFSPDANSWAMVSSIPVNFVRLAATKEIFDHVGETVRLRVRVDFQRVQNSSVFGLLRAPSPARELILVTSHYDAASILPDRAPGVLQALSPALQLQLLEGLLPYRDTLQRDVLFVSFGSSVMASDGHNNILRILRKNLGRRTGGPLVLGNFDPGPGRVLNARVDGNDERQVYFANRWEENERELDRVVRALGLMEVEGFAIDPGKTENLLRDLDRARRELMEEQSRFVIKSLAFDLNEPLTSARVELERASDRDPVDRAPLELFLSAKRRYDEVAAASGYRLVSLLRNKSRVVEKYEFRGRLEDRFRELLRHHQIRRKQILQDTALLNLLTSYDRLGVFSSRVVPAATKTVSDREVLGLYSGNLYKVRAGAEHLRLMGRAKDRLNLGDRTQISSVEELSYLAIEQHTYPSSKLPAAIWGENGYPTAFIYNLERKDAYQCAAYPVDLPFMRDLDSLRGTFSVVGETLLSLVHGNHKLRPVTITSDLHTRTFSGRVLASDVGRSLVPDFPVVDALVAGRSLPNRNAFAYPGYYRSSILMTDPYGNYEAPFNANDFAVFETLGTEGGHSPVAAKMGPDGRIAFIKDEGAGAQRLFKSTQIPYREGENLTLILFRAAPLALLDLTNPQSLKEYTGVEMLRREGLVSFDQWCKFGGRSSLVTYLKPDQRAYLVMQSGEPGNDLAKVPRAFLLNADGASADAGEGEIAGAGYLVADHPFLLDAQSETALSMASVNGRRLALQNRYQMADRQVNVYHRKALSSIEESETEGLSKRESGLLAQDAVTWSILVHPVLRGSVFEAVIGILWYLGLLVPFVFFSEKLLFCFTDVRKQIVAQAVLFLIVFGLLRLLHPAFEMVRSSLMILLGFVIILISTAITLLFAGKFRENLEGLRRKQGVVAAAEVNKLGVLASAFMLGLNNMHRRRLRTGLTCATITLITFVMICFTSVENKIVQKSTAVGKAPYQGMLIKRAQMGRILKNEVMSIDEKFGDRYDICPRLMYVGIADATAGQYTNPDLEMIASSERGIRKADFDSIIQLSYREPMRHRVRFLTETAWFSEEDEGAIGTPVSIFVPDRMAERLNVSVADVNRGGVDVRINGEAFRIRGIFDSGSYDEMTDLDGHRILPFDAERLEVVPQRGFEGISAGENDPKVAAENVVLAAFRPLSLSTGAETSWERVISIAVSMPEASYREAKDAIDGYLEQTGEPLAYGIDGVAFVGQRTRKVSLSGYVDLLIPLLIATLTVLNTMRGSVYERRDEIYVYNSVGIAPGYVFLMFCAEALVYAVVGTMLGYLLSQGVGRVLVVFGLTGGLNMNFTSISTIYVSLAVIAAVLVSTYFPAKSAMEISAPADDAGWELPDPVDDQLCIDLPFTFRVTGRLAILVFFERWLRDHGEGGAGRFFAGDPVLDAKLTDREDAESAYLPRLTSTIWLKPFDLAVSQELVIETPPDVETEGYKARITLKRRSGTRESWMRLNRSFVSLLRRRFLHWRAVRPDEREEMFEEAKSQLLAWRARQDQVETVSER